MHDQRRQLVFGNDAAEVVQAVKSERQADRIRGLECELVGLALGGEADRMLALEQGRNVRPIVTSSASVSTIRGSRSASSSRRERSEKPPLPTRWPSGAQNHLAPM